MEQKRRLFAFLPVVLLLIFVFSTSSQAAGLAKKIKVKAGNDVVLTFQGSSQNVVWKSSKSSVVKIVFSDNSKVVLKACKKGTAKITAKADGKTYTCRVSVKNNKAMPKTLTLAAGDCMKLSVSKKASWSTADPSIVTIGGRSKGSKKNKIIAVRAGTTVVTADTGKHKYTCRVTVFPANGEASAPSAGSSPAPSVGMTSVGETPTADKTTVVPPSDGENGNAAVPSAGNGNRNTAGIPADSGSTNSGSAPSDSGSRESTTNSGNTGSGESNSQNTGNETSNSQNTGSGNSTNNTETMIPGTVHGFNCYSSSRVQGVKLMNAGTENSDGSRVLNEAFLSNGSESWLDSNVTFQMEDVTPEAIRKIFKDMGIASAAPVMNVKSGADEVAFDLRYGFSIDEPVTSSGTYNSTVEPVGGKIIQISAGPATRVIKLTAKQGEKVLDIVYMYLVSDNYNGEYSAYDQNLYKKIRHKAEAQLWNAGMSNLDKIREIAWYINNTCHYPSTGCTDKNANPSYWKRFSVDDRFLYYYLNDVLMNRILDFQGGQITCQAAGILERVATEDMGLEYLYDSDTNTIKEGEGVYLGMGSGSSFPQNPMHETLWYQAKDGTRKAIDAQGMMYDADSPKVKCENHCCQEKLISLK